jgi:hypothetical protein
MLKPVKRLVTVVALLLAASAPSIAYARLEFNPPRPPTTGGPVPVSAAPSVQRATASFPQGFQWGDAGIGAAGVLVLLSLTSGVLLARRRRSQHPLTS